MQGERQMPTARAHKSRFYYILVAVLLACSVYVWQVATTWGEEVNQAAQDTLLRSTSTLGRYGMYGVSGYGSGFLQRSMQTIELKGIGIAAGASGSLLFNTRYASGQLHVQDLPVLPDSKVYQLWCIDAAGTVDAASAFKMPIDTEGDTTVSIIAPRLLYAYVHFRITIQPIGDRTVPGLVVMAY